MEKLISMKRIIASAALAILNLLLPWIGSAQGQSYFPIGYSSLGGTYAFISLIEEQRLLEQEGIRPTFIYIGGPQITQALVSGDIRMAIVAGASPVRAAAQGADLKFVGGVTDKENITIIADAKITKPADLKGTRMAIDRLGDYTDFRARKVLERYGLVCSGRVRSCNSTPVVMMSGSRIALRRCGIARPLPISV